MCSELATKLGTRYCSEEDLVELLLSRSMCSRVSTFEVKATLVGDLNEWISVKLDKGHASTADVKEGVERSKGIRPEMQELFRYDDTWTGTEGCGGSGHSAAQEEAAFLKDGSVFEGPCSVLVSVNEAFAVVLEGHEEGDPRHGMMGVYERLDRKDVNGRGVWQLLGNDAFLFYAQREREDDGRWHWWVGDKEDMETGKGRGYLKVPSDAVSPTDLTETWTATEPWGSWVSAPRVRRGLQ
jgi:hypothetical protein